MPNFIIEIVSEYSRYRDTVRKRVEYWAEYEYWIIDLDSYKNSIFLKKVGNQFESVQFLSQKIESSAIKGLFFKKEWIWSGNELPRLEIVFKELNLI